MAIFTITSPQTITQLQGKSGDDTYNINGGILIIDCDSRYGVNQGVSSGPIGNVLASATLGGQFNITSKNVKLIQFTSGSGGTPPSGTIITQGTSSCELICIMQNRTGGTVYTGGMPNTGWIKVRSVVGDFVSGPLSGINASATTTHEDGWIVVVGVETRTHTISRMGESNIDGNWFEVGSTSGTRGQTIQLPHFTADGATYYPGVDIETAVGSGVYDFWHNVGSKFISTNLPTDSRARFVHISSTGLVTIGKGIDNNATGLLPSNGLRVRIPGVILQNCSSSNKAITNEPNATMGTRYESNYSGAGVLRHSISTGTWYWNLIQAYSLDITDLHTADQLIIGECAQPLNIDQIHVGLSTRATPLGVYAFVIQQCYSGGNIGTISAVRGDGTTTNSYCITFVNMYGDWVVDRVRSVYATDCTAISSPFFINMCDDLVVNYVENVGKRVLVFSSNRVKIRKVVYADNVKQTTQTTSPTHAVEVTTQARDCEVHSVENWPDAINVHPYNGVFYCSNAFGTRFRGTGTDIKPFDCGTVNQSGYMYSDGGNNTDVRCQRNWFKNLRIGLSSSTNTSTKQLVENCYNVDATKTQGVQQLNAVIRGNRQNAGSVPGSFVSVYGVHFWDAFTSDTTTRCAVVFTEKTAFTASSYNINSGNPKFTSQGAITMQAGDSVTWNWSHKILGWTGLTTHAKQGTKTQNFTIEYDVDKGLGYSGIYKVLSDVNLASEQGISPTGFSLRIKISCQVSDITNLLTSLRIDGTTTLALQNSAFYPLDTAKLELSGLSSGSTIAVFEETPTNGTVPVAFASGSGTSAIMQYSYKDSVSKYTVRIRKPGFDVIELVYINRLFNSIPVAQQENKDGFGVPIYGRGKGTTAGLVSFDPALIRVDIGNARAIGEDVYDVVSDYQASEVGVRYPEILRFDGTDILMMNSWLFRRKQPTYSSAGIDALPVVDGAYGTSPDDESNGSVDFRARSVRTYSENGGIAINDESVAEAVQVKLNDDFANLESRIINPLYDAVNAHLHWYVLTRDTEMIGVTTDSPFDKDIQNVSIHEMEGPIPDLNFYSWNYDTDTFKCNIFTRIEFLAKFSVQELLSIRASMDSMVKTIIERIDTKRYVDVKDQLNIDSVNYLQQVGILTPSRVIEILG